MKWSTISIPRTSDPDDELDELTILHSKKLFVAQSIKDHTLGGWQPATTATLLAAWDLVPSSVFFDVGANVGIFASLHARLWPEAISVAFEPTPDIADCGTSITSANGLDVRWVRSAVSDSEGEATLYLSARSDASNSLNSSHRRPKGTVTVPTVTLDGYVHSSGLVPSVVKIDVERHEPAVIRGAAELCDIHKPIVVAELLPGRPESDELQRLLAGHGYYARLIESPPGAAPPAKESARDWLFWPGSVPPEYDDRFHAWYSALARCGPVSESAASASPALKP